MPLSFPQFFDLICAMCLLSHNQTPSGNPEPSSLLLCRFSFLHVPSSLSLGLSKLSFLSFFLFDLFALCMLFYIYGFSIYSFIYLFYTFICLMRVLLCGFSIILLLLLFFFIFFGVWFYLPYVFSFMCLAMESCFEHNN